MSNIAELQRAARALQPITLPQAPALVVCGIAIFTSAILIFVRDLSSTPIYGTFMILGLAFLVFAGLISLLPGATYFSLDRDGVTRCICFQKKIVRWSEIRSIRGGWLGYERARISWNRQVLIDYRRDDKNELCAIFPHMFRLNAEELMSLLTPYYEGARREVIAPDGKIPAAA